MKVSFEPNSKHISHLEKLSSSYATCGIKVLVYRAGVGNKNTKYGYGFHTEQNITKSLRVKFAPFNSLLGQEVQHDASGRLIHQDEGQYIKPSFLPLM